MCDVSVRACLDIRGKKRFILIGHFYRGRKSCKHLDSSGRLLKRLKTTFFCTISKISARRASRYTGQLALFSHFPTLFPPFRTTCIGGNLIHRLSLSVCEQGGGREREAEAERESNMHAHTLSVPHTHTDIRTLLFSVAF